MINLCYPPSENGLCVLRIGARLGVQNAQVHARIGQQVLNSDAPPSRSLIHPMFQVQIQVKFVNQVVESTDP